MYKTFERRIYLYHLKSSRLRQHNIVKSVLISFKTVAIGFQKTVSTTLI